MTDEMMSPKTFSATDHSEKKIHNVLWIFHLWKWKLSDWNVWVFIFESNMICYNETPKHVFHIWTLNQTSILIQVMIFWVVTPCSNVVGYYNLNLHCYNNFEFHYLYSFSNRHTTQFIVQENALCIPQLEKWGMMQVNTKTLD